MNQLNVVTRQNVHTLTLLAATIAAALSAEVAAQAAPAAEEKKADAVVVDKINIVGTRRANASATDTPVPVDFIPLSKSAEQGSQFDLAQTLQFISPSFNSTR